MILLPPSEGKTAPVAGEPVDLDALAFPSLTKTRERLLAVLSRLTFPRALKYLDIGAGLTRGGGAQPDAARRRPPRRRTRSTPACCTSTSGSARCRPTRVLIASALWGFVRPTDRIPAYRLSMGATLPRIPSLPALWRDPLRRALPDSGLIVDLRSGAYTAAWKPKQATVVGVRAFTDGKTVSHMVKATRGDVARILLSHDPVDTPEDVASLVRAAGLQVELTGSGRAWNLDVTHMT